MKKSVFLKALALLMSLAILIGSGAVAMAQADVATPQSVPINQLIIKYKAEANLNEPVQAQANAQMQRLNAATGITLEYFRPMSGDAHVLRLPQAVSIDEAEVLSAQLASLPEVEYAEPDYLVFSMGEPSENPLVEPNDTYYGDQWHYFAPSAGNYGVNAPAAWDITTGNANVYVAVLDTGITDHADLSNRWIGGYDMVSEALMGNDGDGRDSDPHDPGDWITAAESGSGFFAGCPVSDSSWHGTHVGGTIAAATNNGTGVAGLNWVSKVVPVRVLGKCGGYTSDIADGIRWAAGLPVSGVPANPYPAKVLNMSLGGLGSCTSTYQDAIDAAYAAGAVIVVSAGNSAADAGGYRPASCNNIITVSASDRYGDLAYYSNYGSVVEISAPGGETNIYGDGVLSTLNTGTLGPAADTYEYYQGTSMAAPHVAGIASLMFSVNPSLPPSQVLSIIQSTATSFPGGSSCNTTICGSGIINAANAVAAVPGLAPATPVLAAISNPDGDGDFTVDWNDVANATSYTLQEADNATFIGAQDIYTGTVSQHAETGNTAGTWYYRVKASNADGDSDWSNTVSIMVKPDAPTLDTITNPSNADAYSVNWSAATAADGYLLQQADNASFTSATTRYMGADTQYDVTGQAGGTWYYRVNAYNDAGSSDWSNAEMVTVTLSALNAPVLSPIDNADGDGDYTVQWSTVVSATSYVLEQSDNPYFVNPSLAYSGTMTQTNVIGQTGGMWYYRVRAFSPTDQSPWSDSQSAEVARPVYLPMVLANLKGIPIEPVLAPINNTDGDGNYTVSWGQADAAETYVLQEDDNATFTSPTTAYSGANTSWDATGKAPGTYYYRVMSSNSVGDSGWSNVQFVNVPTPTGAKPGYWESQYEDFYVSLNGANVLEFSTHIYVSGCGNYTIIHTKAEPITNKSFSFSGIFYASGIFGSYTTASGSDGLSKFPISGCGLITGGPWNWSATWMNSSQPTVYRADVEAPYLILPVSGDLGQFRVVQVEP